jgi:DNA primase
MAMIQHGFFNTVATLGTACTVEHLKQLARYAEHIFVVYDSDNAGKMAVLRLTELCWQVNLELKVIMLPAGEDPASFFAKKGDMNERIAAGEDIFHYFLSALGTNFVNKSLGQKIQTARSFLSVITNIADPLKKDILLQKAAKTFDIPFQSLKQELASTQEKVSTSEHKHHPDQKQSEDAPQEAISLLEKRIFCAIMNNMGLFSGEGRCRLIRYIQSPLQDILAQLQGLKEKSVSVSFGSFFDTLNERDRQYVSKLLLEEDEIVDATAFDKLLGQLQKKQWKSIVQTIKTQLTRAQQEGNTDKEALILRDFMELQSKFITTSHHD